MLLSYPSWKAQLDDALTKDLSVASRVALQDLQFLVEYAIPVVSVIVKLFVNVCLLSLLILHVQHELVEHSVRQCVVSCFFSCSSCFLMTLDRSINNDMIVPDSVIINTVVDIIPRPLHEPT